MTLVSGAHKKEKTTERAKIERERVCASLQTGGERWREWERLKYAGGYQMEGLKRTREKAESDGIALCLCFCVCLCVCVLDMSES